MTTPTATSIIDGRRIVVCVGTGGVGKTTVSSAIAIAAAQRGRRALVLTIDPARRLADALGLEDLGSTPERLAPEHATALGIEGPGALFAMMLDMKGTFDDLVTRLCQDERTREEILGNPLYQHISDALAGSVEYAAMEKVHELAQSAEWDLIVVDTPPAQHALDFLDAPERLVTLLDSSLVRLLVQPAFSAGRFGLRLFAGAAERTLGLVARLSGVNFLKEISGLLLSIDSLSDGFKERARSVRALLRGPDCAFLLVASPSPATASQAFELLAGLEASGIDLAGILVNRVHAPWEGARSAGVIGPLDEEATERLARCLAAVHVEAPRDAAHAALTVTREYALQAEADARQTGAIERAASARNAFVTSLPSVHEREDEASTLRELAQAIGAAGPVPLEGGSR